MYRKIQKIIQKTIQQSYGYKTNILFSLAIPLQLENKKDTIYSTNEDMFIYVCIDTYTRNNYKILIKEIKDLNNILISAYAWNIKLKCQNADLNTTNTN